MVEITYLAIAGIALAAMFFGYGFGLFEGRSQGYKKRQKEESAHKAETPAPEPVTVKVDDPGMLRIKNEGGYLALDLDGARVDTRALTADERKRLIEMLGLNAYLAGVDASIPTRSKDRHILPTRSTTFLSTGSGRSLPPASGLPSGAAWE